MKFLVDLFFFEHLTTDLRDFGTGYGGLNWAK